MNIAEAKPEKRFETPLFEVVAEIHLDPVTLVELPARSMYAALMSKYPEVQTLSSVLISEPAQALNMFAPAYRFYNQERTRTVQIGPRLIAFNALLAKSSWPGWPTYRDESLDVFETFARMNSDAPVLRFSLSFYNRIPVVTLDEARGHFKDGLPGPPGTLPADYTFQFAVEWERGIVARHFTMMLPDAFTTTSFLAVNTVARFEVGGRRLAEALSEWQAWVEPAHEICKATFYSSLSKSVQDSWNKTHAEKETSY